jgi:glycosyltransferase involved in cell wall biosynthesis
METPRIAILIPAFNEERTIGAVIDGAMRFGDIFVSDDGSTDKTAEVATRSGATVLSQGENHGYNSALNFGYQSLLTKGYSGIVSIDADGQHNPNEIQLFVEGLLDGFDVVLGIRPKKARVMESIFGLVTHSLWGVKDPLCGMKAYKVKILREKDPLATYDSIGTEILMFSLATGLRVKNIAISGGDRDGTPRFAGKLRANLLIGMALIIGLTRIRSWSRGKR